MKKLFLIVAVFAISQIGFAQDAFKKDVLKYLDLSGAVTPMKNIASNFEQAMSAEDFEAFKKDFDATLPSLVDKIADVYMEEFTHQEIKDVIKFYESPIGKKLAAKSEVLYEKGQKAGEKWGLELQAILMKYLQ